MKKMPLTIKTDYVTHGRRNMDQRGRIQGERISYLTFFCHGAGQKDHDFEDKKAVLV